MNVKPTKKAVAAVIAASALVATGLLSGSASADPQGLPTYRALAGVGSDTTQGVMNGLAEVVKDDSGVKLIASYDATGSATIQTKDTGCTLNRPDGSGAGRTALLTSLIAADGCVDFSRSSDLSLGATQQSLTYIPFAVDAVSYAINRNSSVPKNLTTAALQAVYRCEVPSIVPLLPQAGSGTRKYWLGKMNVTEAQLLTPAFSCVKDTKNGQPVQEHDGRSLTAANELMPYSVAQYIAQSYGVIADRRGNADLGSVDGVAPITLNTSFSIKRDVYNVVPTAKLGVSPVKDVFVGPDSKICQQSLVIQKYGFGLNANCGSTTNQTPVKAKAPSPHS